MINICFSCVIPAHSERTNTLEGFQTREDDYRKENKKQAEKFLEVAYRKHLQESKEESDKKKEFQERRHEGGGKKSQRRCKWETDEKVEKSFCWPEYGSVLRRVQRGRGVFLCAYLVAFSPVSIFSSLSLLRQVSAWCDTPVCRIVFYRRYWTQQGHREMKDVLFVFLWGKRTMCVFVCVRSCSFQMPRHPVGLHPASPWLSGVWYVLDVTRTPQPSGPPPDSGMRVHARACQPWQGRGYLQSPMMPTNYSNALPSRWLPPPAPPAARLINVPSFSRSPPPLSIWEPLKPLSFLTRRRSRGLSGERWLYINLVLLSPCSHRCL